MRRGLSKTERLRGRQSFARVISQGKSIFVKPIRCFFISRREAKTQMQAGFAVGRDIRGAVRRNIVKRRLKDSYRSNKHLIASSSPESNETLCLVFIFVGQINNKKQCSKEIDRAMKTILPQIS